jgi:uncharacterized protein with PIN domain
MRVPNCYICDSNPDEKARAGEAALEDGEYCPVCNKPFCRHHSGTVRWRERATREVKSARVCIQCKRAYLHRSWDSYNREWIS